MADNPHIKITVPPLSQETIIEVGERLMTIIPPGVLTMAHYDAMYLALRMGACLVVKDLPSINGQCSFCLERQNLGL